MKERDGDWDPRDYGTMPAIVLPDRSSGGISVKNDAIQQAYLSVLAEWRGLLSVFFGDLDFGDQEDLDFVVCSWRRVDLHPPELLLSGHRSLKYGMGSRSCGLG